MNPEYLLTQELNHIYKWYATHSTDRYGRMMKFYMLYKCLNQNQDDISRWVLDADPTRYHHIEWMEYCGNLMLKGVKYYSKYNRGKYDDIPRELLDDFIQEMLNYQEWATYMFVRWNEQCKTLTCAQNSCRVIREALDAISSQNTQDAQDTEQDPLDGRLSQVDDADEPIYSLDLN